MFPHSAGYHWGSTPEERSWPYPCDRYIPEPDDTLFRAVTTRATPAEVYRWLCQLRVAPYSYDWLDNGGHASPQKLIPGLEMLAVGQRFMTIFELLEFETDGHITLRIDHPGAQRLFGEIAGTYLVKPLSPSETRLIVKLVCRRPARRRNKWIGPLLPWGDLIMMRKQLLNLKRLSERPT
jgi:hypothetical protein